VILSVTRRETRFFTQFTGEPPFELFAENDKEFFLKAADAQISFETDAANGAVIRLNGTVQRAPRNAQLTFEVDETGHPTAVVLHQNGLDQRARRIE
jgi:hypothetical protein